MEEEEKLRSKVAEIESRIDDYQNSELLAKQSHANETDDLDEFMSGLSNEKMLDKTDIRKFRVNNFYYLYRNLFFP